MLGWLGVRGRRWRNKHESSFRPEFESGCILKRLVTVLFMCTRALAPAEKGVDRCMELVVQEAREG